MSETTAIDAQAQAQPVNAAFAKDRPSWELLSTCVHCGLCLNHCPTYKVLGNEMDSPRGRIYQVLQVNEGKMELGDTFVTHIDRCLGCVACEIACPSGVKYGRIVERARAQIEQGYKRPFIQRTLRGFFYKKVIPNFAMLRRVARLMRFYQRSGMQTLVRKSGLLKLLGVADLDKLSPQIDQEFFFDEIGKVFPAVGEKRGQVAFVAGCINNVAFSHLNRATVNVLTQNGIEVNIPAGQGCCGALHAHAGLRDEARELARHNIDVSPDPKQLLVAQCPRGATHSHRLSRGAPAIRRATASAGRECGRAWISLRGQRRGVGRGDQRGLVLGRLPRLAGFALGRQSRRL